MAIVVGAIVATFFIVAAFSALLRRCAESHLTQQSNNTELPCSCSKGGIDPETLETFPTLFYSSIKHLRIRKAETPLECAVCLTEFTDNDTLRLIPHCNHVFHPPCIDTWLSSHVTCPVCRANLSQDPGQFAVLLEGGENDAEVSGSRAEQSNACGAGEGEIEGCPVAREGEGNGEEDKGLREQASRSKLVVKGKVLARSNTTGHSVVEAGECVERYTLRLPEDVRKYILLNHGVMMWRSASYNVVGSSRKGLCWSDSEGGSSRGKRNIVGVKGQGSVKGKGRV